MNENLDLIKILEGCPEGTKFYSSIYGNVCFIRISHLSSYPIELMGCTKTFKMSTDVYTTKEGLDKHNFNGECTLFPSKDQRDWSKFVRFWDKSKKDRFDINTLQPFDKILARDYSSDNWECALFSHIEKLKSGDRVLTVGSFYNMCIPYNEETKYLVGTTEDCPDYYKWWKK